MSNEDFIKNLARDIKSMHKDRVKWHSEIVSACRKESGERREEVAKLKAGFKKEREATRDAWKNLLSVMASLKEGET